MRRNKTYSAQCKYYDVDVLASVLIYWYSCNRDGNRKQILETYREGNKKCREMIVDELLESLNNEESNEARGVLKILLLG